MIVEFNAPATGLTIGDKHYAIAERTLSVCQSIEKVEQKFRKSNAPEWKIKLAELCVLLGEENVREIFPDEVNLNLDFLDTVFAAAFSEFTEHSRKTAEQFSGRAQQSAELGTQLENVAALLKMLLDVNASATAANHIRREK